MTASQTTATQPITGLDQPQKSSYIQAIVRGLEDRTKLRMATGQRIAAEFHRRHTGAIDRANTPAEKTKLQKEYDNILEELKRDYVRVTDGIVDDRYDIITGHLPKPKKFEPSEMINSYAMLITVDQYIRSLTDEKIAEKQLETALGDCEIYTEYLKNVKGIGPKMAGVLIGEFDPEKTRYVSNMESRAGLNTVIVGKIDKPDGTVEIVPHMAVMEYFEKNPGSSRMFLSNGTEVRLSSVGSSKKSYCLRQQTYRKADGSEGVKLGIGFNPYLQAKLLAVMAPAFLKVGVTYLDDEPSTKFERMRVANAMGFDETKFKPLEQAKACNQFLIEHDHSVEIRPGRIGQFYYDYRNRIQQSVKPEHKNLTLGHIHRMSLRYLAKMYLREYYIVMRHLAGLPIYQTYEAAKLGYQVHLDPWVAAKFNLSTKDIVLYDRPKSELSYPAGIQSYLNQRNQPMAIMEHALVDQEDLEGIED